MEDDRDKLVVVVAGYTDEIQKLINSNPGLKSRFNRYFYFNDYEPAELLEMFTRLVEKKGYKIAPDAMEQVETVLQRVYESRDKTFGNGRFVRNLFEQMIQGQANRISMLAEITEDKLVMLTEEDVNAVAGQYVGMARSAGKPIGFRKD
jgi:hypothetical protein